MGAEAILSRISVGTVVAEIAIKGGIFLLGAKWAGFDAGNAVFVVPAAGLVFIPISEIVAVVL
ncbi:hypothetical protein [Cohnella sp. 56]|uniref:hypothetical protein n=1 Tax=Cohnella sp. 56 TaxID=3113722 RepID=UPI0030EA60AD